MEENTWWRNYKRGALSGGSTGSRRKVGGASNGSHGPLGVEDLMRPERERVERENSKMEKGDEQSYRRERTQFRVCTGGSFSCSETRVKQENEGKVGRKY